MNTMDKIAHPLHNIELSSHSGTATMSCCCQFQSLHLSHYGQRHMGFVKKKLPTLLAWAQHPHLKWPCPLNCCCSHQFKLKMTMNTRNYSRALLPVLWMDALKMSLLINGVHIFCEFVIEQAAFKQLTKHSSFLQHWMMFLSPVDISFWIVPACILWVHAPVETTDIAMISTPVTSIDTI